MEGNCLHGLVIQSTHSKIQNSKPNIQIILKISNKIFNVNRSVFNSKFNIRIKTRFNRFLIDTEIQPRFRNCLLREFIYSAFIEFMHIVVDFEFKVLICIRKCATVFIHRFFILLKFVEVSL